MPKKACKQPVGKVCHTTTCLFIAADYNMLSLCQTRPRPKTQSMKTPHWTDT